MGLTGGTPFISPVVHAFGFSSTRNHFAVAQQMNVLSISLLLLRSPVPCKKQRQNKTKTTCISSMLHGHAMLKLDPSRLPVTREVHRPIDVSTGYERYFPDPSTIHRSHGPRGGDALALLGSDSPSFWRKGAQDQCRHAAQHLSSILLVDESLSKVT
ncbi:hypothetical protein ACA910_009761 [Epithemia clementina (nom. ined.)]